MRPPCLECTISGLSPPRIGAFGSSRRCSATWRRGRCRGRRRRRRRATRGIALAALATGGEVLVVPTAETAPPVGLGGTATAAPDGFGPLSIRRLAAVTICPSVLPSARTGACTEGCVTATPRTTLVESVGNRAGHALEEMGIELRLISASAALSPAAIGPWGHGPLSRMVSLESSGR